VIPRQSVARAIRQRQDPLAHRHPREHLFDEIGGAFGHPPPPTARTEAASFAGEGHEALERAVGTPKPREALGQYPAAQEVAKLLLDEPWQAAAVLVRHRPQEGLQVFANDGVEHGALGVTGPVDRALAGHGPGGVRAPAATMLRD
jgi:hypothetical protein